MASEDLDRAMTLLKQGAAADQNSARVTIIMGRLFKEKGYNAKIGEILQTMKTARRDTRLKTHELLQYLQRSIW
ncbi:hypothetical protein HmCmsJML019_03263 [Escherichia coli]|nr:hypothetical protein HmCmsJML019_03263 [Escherichia coli]